MYIQFLQCSYEHKIVLRLIVYIKIILFLTKINKHIWFLTFGQVL